MTSDELPIKILAAIKAAPDGLTRTQIRELVGGRVTKDRIDIILYKLEANGLTTMSVEDTGGRPAERWVFKR